MGTEPGIIVWLVVLTGLSIVSLAMGVLLYVRLTNMPTGRELDLSEKMERVLHIADSSVALKNDKVRRHLLILLDSIEADPMAAEKFYTQTQTLRRALTE